MVTSAIVEAFAIAVDRTVELVATSRLRTELGAIIKEKVRVSFAMRAALTMQKDEKTLLPT